MVWGACRDCPAIILFFGPGLVQDQLESVLEVLHRQMEQYRDQPQHLEKIAYQQRLLQEDLVHIRAELSRESTVRGGCGGWQALSRPHDRLARALFLISRAGAELVVRGQSLGVVELLQAAS